MPSARNAFKIRAADAPVLDASQFLQLYCPLVLNELERDDFVIPKLLVVRGSPGSGKSSLLRILDPDILLALHSGRARAANQELIERLTELGVLTAEGPRIAGLYVQCDSALRDTANLPEELPRLHFLNAFLDARLVALFVRSVLKLGAAGCLAVDNSTLLRPLDESEAIPALFAETRTLGQMAAACAEIERGFGALLNSFPGDPLPAGIQPHARLYAPAFLTKQVTDVSGLDGFMPVVMLDDVQELYSTQREHVRTEFMRRAGIARWLSVRAQVVGLEELISLEGVESGRDYREVLLDQRARRSANPFPKFAANVVHRRMVSTDTLVQAQTGSLRDALRPPSEAVSYDVAGRALEALIEVVSKRSSQTPLVSKLRERRSSLGADGVSFGDLRRLEEEVILFVRQANRGQIALLPELEPPEPANAKTGEAADLFASRRVGRPYYAGFPTLIALASENVEQLLSTAAALVDEMIDRADLNRDASLSATEQEAIFRRCAGRYYRSLDEKHKGGTAIRQFVDNLGAFCHEVTSRPNAPIAPGVNGFGFTLQQLGWAVERELPRDDATLFRDVLTHSVAGNVFSVRATKQGQASTQKVVLYLNRLLCVHYGLPLNYGGFQQLPSRLLVRMMKEPVPLREMVKRGSSEVLALWSEEQ